MRNAKLGALAVEDAHLEERDAADAPLASVEGHEIADAKAPPEDGGKPDRQRGEERNEREAERGEDDEPRARRGALIGAGDEGRAEHERADDHAEAQDGARRRGEIRRHPRELRLAHLDGTEEEADEADDDEHREDR